LPFGRGVAGARAWAIALKPLNRQGLSDERNRREGSLDERTEQIGPLDPSQQASERPNPLELDHQMSDFDLNVVDGRAGTSHRFIQ
jgi:hypothetical protein